MRRFTPSPFDAGPQYGGALSIPAVAKMLPSALAAAAAAAAPSKKSRVLRMAAKAGLGVVGIKFVRGSELVHLGRIGAKT